MAHTNHAEILPSGAEDAPEPDNKAPSSSESSSSSSSSSDSDEDYNVDAQKNPQKPGNEIVDAVDSDDDDDDDEDDDDYEGGDNEIEIDDRTKGKRKDGLYAEEIDIINDRINKRK